MPGHYKAARIFENGLLLRFHWLDKKRRHTIVLRVWVRKATKYVCETKHVETRTKTRERHNYNLC